MSATSSIELGFINSNNECRSARLNHIRNAPTLLKNAPAPEAEAEVVQKREVPSAVIHKIGCARDCNLELEKMFNLAPVSVALQPIMVLRENSLQVSSFEALSRWRNLHDGEFVSPIDAIGRIEEEGCAMELAEMLFNESVKEFKQIAEVYPNASLAFNVTPKQLTDISFAQNIARWIKQNEIEASAITIELSEQTIVSNVDILTPVLMALRCLGVKISLDDFGAGVTSLGVLGRLPIDEIKIDQALLIASRDNPMQKEVLITLGHLFRSLGIKSVVEGIETEADFERSKLSGFDHYQGYLFSKPRKASELRRLTKFYTPSSKMECSQ